MLVPLAHYGFDYKLIIKLFLYDEFSNIFCKILSFLKQILQLDYIQFYFHVFFYECFSYSLFNEY